VDKTFLEDDSDVRLTEAQREFERLERMFSALVEVPGVTSPRPLELLAGTSPTIRMGAVPGRPLLEVLRSRPLSTDHLAELATAAATGVTAYVRDSGEAYFDFQFDNMLYDESSATLGFVDLGVPDDSETVQWPMKPLDISLGNLVGSTLFQSARPRWLSRRRQHRQAVALCYAIVDRAFEASPDAVTAEGVRRAAAATYRRCAFSGGRYKRLWYSTGGYVLSKRMTLMGNTFGPVRTR